MKTKKKNKKSLKGAVVCYLDVGNLNPDKVDGLVGKTNKQMKPFIKDIKKQGCAYITIPVRGQPTQLVFLPLPSA